MSTVDSGHLPRISKQRHHWIMGKLILCQHLMYQEEMKQDHIFELAIVDWAMQKIFGIDRQSMSTRRVSERSRNQIYKPQFTANIGTCAIICVFFDLCHLLVACCTQNSRAQCYKLAFPSACTTWNNETHMTKFTWVLLYLKIPSLIEHEAHHIIVLAANASISYKIKPIHLSFFGVVVQKNKVQDMKKRSSFDTDYSASWT